jgi:hypothetical protein
MPARVTLFPVFRSAHRKIFRASPPLVAAKCKLEPKISPLRANNGKLRASFFSYLLLSHGR